MGKLLRYQKSVWPASQYRDPSERLQRSRLIIGYLLSSQTSCSLNFERQNAAKLKGFHRNGRAPLAVSMAKLC